MVLLKLLQRALRSLEQRFRPHWRSGRFFHPEVRSQTSLTRHSLELAAQVSRASDLLLDLPRDHRAYRIVRQVQHRIDHVRVDPEQHDVATPEDRRIEAIPDLARDSERRVSQLCRCRIGMSVHPAPHAHVHERHAADLIGTPEVVEHRQRLAGRIRLSEAEQFEVTRLEDEGERLGERGVRHPSSALYWTSFREKVCSMLCPSSWTAML